MRTAIVVLGMHRSGTSAMTWLLRQAGAATPVDPLPPQRDNPMGFWESTALVAEHNRLLRKARSSWSDTRAFDALQLKPGELAEAKARIEAAIEGAWPGETLMAIKDPRICRFAPMFLEVLQEMGIEARVVLALRSPDAVVASLQAREGMGADYGRLLWLRHMLEAERATRKVPRIAIDYDCLVENWRSVVPAVSQIVGNNWAPDQEQEAVIDDFLKPGLRHHNGSEPSARGPLHNNTDRIWKGLSALTDRDDFEARRELSRAYHRFNERPWVDGDILHAEVRRLNARARSGWRSSEAEAAQTIKVHVIATLSAAGAQSSAYIRLIRPLTDSTVRDRVRLSLDGHAPVLPECDVCIVQRAALPDAAAADALLAELQRRGAPLVVDLDDDFRAMSSEQIAAGKYTERLEALDRLLAASSEVWFSSHRLAETCPAVSDRAVIIPNAVDPALWRRWRQDASAEPRPKTRFLYMGTGTHAEDFAVVRPHLEALWREREGTFDVTLIGVAREIEPAPWLTHMQAPADCRVYPKFVAWLLQQGPFDIGLAPLADTPFNHAKSDIKLLDYSALGLSSMVSDSPAYQFDPVFRSALVVDWPKALRAALDHPQDQRKQAAVAAAHTWLNRTVSFAAVTLLDRIEAVLSRPEAAGDRL